jgi:hypothetical protein
MLFFDFKIILILGLSVAIYFIYREVETMHLRLLKLEAKKFLSNHNVDMGASILLPMVHFTQPTKSIIVDFDETKTDVQSSIGSVKQPTNEPFESKFIEVYSNNTSDKQESEHVQILDASSVDMQVDINNLPDVNIINYDEVQETKPELTTDDLNKLKMPELTQIAQNMDISLMKMNNGVSKKKLKQELVNEIISKKNI